MHHFRKLLAAVLVVVLMFQQIPASVLADPASDETDPFQVESSAQEEEPSVQYAQPSTFEHDDSSILSSNTVTSDFASLTVLQEVESLRDVREKHYRLSDGSYAAVYYDEPVHFEAADGSFHQIDNTIKEDARDDKKIYSAIAGELTKEFASSLQDGSLFSMEYRQYRIAISALKKQDMAGRQTEPITEGKIEEGDGAIEDSLLSSVGFSLMGNNSVLAEVDPSDMNPLIISDKGRSIEDAGEIAHYV